MRSEESNKDVAELRKQWCRWTAIVTTLAKRRDARPRLRSKEYSALHNALVEECQSHATNSDAAQREFFLEMKNVVKPWISLQTLGQAEYRVLVSLARRCREIERGLGGPVHFPDGLRRVALTVGLILVLSTAICVVAVVAGQWSTAGVLQSGRDGVSRLAYLLRGTNWAQRFGVITVIVVIVAIHCVRTSARDY